MHLNIIDSRLIIETNQQKLQEWFLEFQGNIREYLEEWDKDIAFPDIDFNQPVDQWVSQIPEEFKFKDRKSVV